GTVPRCQCGPGLVEPLPGTWCGAVSARGCPWPSNTLSIGPAPPQVGYRAVSQNILSQFNRVGYKHGLVCLAEHLLYLKVRLKNCRTALRTIVHNFMIYTRIGGQSNKA
ncbi:unnamed protein product, partial [Ascophyllum nodosum]